MILCSKRKNGVCKIVTKSQIITKSNATKSRLHCMYVCTNLKLFICFIRIPLQEIPEIENSTRSWKGLFDIDTISNNMARLLLAFKMIGLLTCGVWMNFADNIPATVKSGMIICAIGVVIHFCIVCIVSNRITLILTLLLGIFEGFFFWIILAYIDAMETFLLCR